MHTPDFFDSVPAITLYDPLAEMLGSAAEGVITFGYADAVKAAGHSCPTVAGAYLMTLKAAALLYGGERPLRGGTAVALKEPLEAGTAGVTGAIIGYLLGAAEGGGFQGIGGRFGRRHLLTYGAPVGGTVRFTRLDTGAAAEMLYNPGAVPGHPQLPELMQAVVRGDASPETARRFATLWQERVRRILIEEAENPELIRVVG